MLRATHHTRARASPLLQDSKFRLILIESRIHRIARYYKTARQLPPHWRYESATVLTDSYSIQSTYHAGLAPSLPEDLYHLIKKAVAVRKHLERNRNDKDSKFRLILIESRIHRIARYYKTARQLPPNWRYESATASTLVA